MGQGFRSVNRQAKKCGRCHQKCSQQADSKKAFLPFFRFFQKRRQKQQEYHCLKQGLHISRSPPQSIQLRQLNREEIRLPSRQSNGKQQQYKRGKHKEKQNFRSPCLPFNASCHAKGGQRQQSAYHQPQGRMGQHGTAEDFRKNTDFQHGIHGDFSGNKHRQHTAQHTAKGISQPFHHRPCRLFFAQICQHQREKRRQQTANEHYQPASSAASLC